MYPGVLEGFRILAKNTAYLPSVALESEKCFSLVFICLLGGFHKGFAAIGQHLSI